MRGHLTIVEGEYVRQEDVYDWFCEQAKKYEIVTIGYDPANATRLRQMLEGRGFACEVVRQGPVTLNDPMKDVYKRQASKTAGREPSKSCAMNWTKPNRTPPAGSAPKPKARSTA